MPTWLVMLLMAAVCGRAAASDFVPPTPSITVPAQSTGSYTVSWTGTTGAEFTFDLDESGNGSTWTRVGNAQPGTSKSFTKTSSGTRWYRVSACYMLPRGDGGDGVRRCSAFSTVKDVDVYIQPAAAPTLTCTDCANPNVDADITLNWTRPSGTITHYRLFKRRNGGAWQSENLSGANTLTRTLTGLADGTWDFQVDACNVMLSSNCGGDSAVKTFSFIKTPSVPTNLQAPANSTSGTFTLSWSAATGDVDNYSVYRANRSGATCPGSGYGHIADVAGLSKSFTGHADGDFCFKVKACNSGSCSDGSVGKAVTVLKVPTMPTDVVLSDGADSGAFTMSWDPSTETVDYYVVDRAKQGETCPGTEYQFCTIGQVTEPSMSFQGHEDGTYAFKVKACNASGCSDRTVSVGITINKTAVGLPDAEPVHLARPAGENVGTLPGKSSIDGGRVNYSLGIPVPPGRNGMAPSVSLDYSAGGDDGFVGVGWSLSAGQGSIYRCSRIEAVDGETRPYDGSTADRLCMNGSRLVLVSGSYGQPGSVYHTETQSFAKVELLGGATHTMNAWFKVTEKSGQVAYYRELIAPAPAGGGTAYPTRWLLDMVEDLSGNQIEYDYSGGYEQRLLAGIVYTGSNGTQGSRAVVFNYEDHPRPVTTYTPQGARVVRSKRLASIQTQVAGQVVGFFKATYQTSENTGRSILAAVQHCSDTTCAESYPQTSFVYNEQASTFEHVAVDADELHTVYGLGDIDGDGATDSVVMALEDDDDSSLEPVELRMSSQPQPLSLDGWNNVSLSPSLTFFNVGRGTSDFDSDGKADLYRVLDGQLQVGKWNIASRSIDIVSTGLGLDSVILDIGDYDRDGDPDIRTYDSIHFNCSEERGAIRFCGRYDLPAAPAGRTLSSVSDLDGDGLPDFLYGRTNAGPADTVVRFANVSGGSFSLGGDRLLGADLGGPDEIDSDLHHTMSLDLNGDNLPDIYRKGTAGNGGHEGSNELWINQGGRYQSVSMANISIDKQLAGAMVVMDYDNDGRDDVLVPTLLVQDYCYTYWTDAESEDEVVCNLPNGTNPGFLSHSLFDLNRGIYRFDVIRMVERADGSFAAHREETPIVGPVFATSACDYDGDGLSDVCLKKQSGLATLHHGPGSFRAGYYTGVIGPYEVPGMGTHALVARRHQNSFGADLLAKATNGLGVVETWAYGALSGDGHTACSYSDTRPFYSVDRTAARPGHLHFNSSMHVVTRHEISNGVGSRNAECFRFEDAMHSTDGRGFQGFRAITVEEDIGDGHDKATRTRYYDQFPLTGRTMSVETRLLSDAPTATPLTRTVEDWLSQQSDAGVHTVHMAGSEQITYNFDSPAREALSRTTTVNAPSLQDILNGNTGLQVVEHETLDAQGRSLVWNQTSTRLEYDYSVAASGWLDKLDRKTVTVSATDYSDLPGPQPSAELSTDKVVTEDYVYHADGRRLVQTKTLQAGVAGQERREQYGYDEYGNVVSVTATAPDAPDLPRVTQTSFTGTQGYFPVVTTDALGFRTVVGHDPVHGQLTDAVRDDGRMLTQDYDFAGRLLQVHATPGTAKDIISQYCGDCGNAAVRRTTVMDGAPTLVEYLDLAGRVIKTETSGYGDAGPTITTSSYDRRGRLLSSSQPALEEGAYLTAFEAYDAMGRYGRKVVSRAGHAIDAQVWTYNTSGLTTTITLPDGVSTATRTYGAGGELLSTEDANGSTTHHRYDGLGNLILTENAVGTQARNYFDDLGRVLRTEDPDAGTAADAAQAMRYDGFGDLIESVNANGDRVTNEYDAMGRLRLRRINDAIAGVWTYGSGGQAHQLQSVAGGDADADGSADYQKTLFHDGLGRVVRTEVAIEDSPLAFVNRFAYDAYYDRLKGRTYPGNETVGYSYDKHGVMYSARSAWRGEGNADVELFVVDAMNARGQTTGLLYGNGIRGEYDYVDSTGDVGEIRYGAEGAAPLSQLKYRYDDAFGNLTVRESVVAGVSETFTYDALQRLDSSSKVWSNGAIAPKTVDYEYDVVGNLVRKDDFAVAYRYGNPNRDAGGNAGPHAVREVDLVDGSVVSYQYDDAGNLVSGYGRAVAYDVFNKPVRIQQGVDTTVFRYTPDLALAVRNESGVSKFYDDGFELVVSGGAVSEQRVFVAPQAVIETNAQGRKLRFQHHDRMGSLVMVTDEAGAVTEQHGFDAFGLPLAGDWQSSDGLLHGAATGPERLAEQGFTGHEHLDRHKLVHMGGRIYDPQLGRFMSVDPLIQSRTSTQSLNAYSYVMNNPLSGVDPSGYACVIAGTSGTDGGSAGTATRGVRAACESDGDPNGRNAEDQAAMDYINAQESNGRVFQEATVVEAELDENGAVTNVTERDVTGVERTHLRIMSLKERYQLANARQGLNGSISQFSLLKYDPYYFADREEPNEYYSGYVSALIAQQASCRSRGDTACMARITDEITFGPEENLRGDSNQRITNPGSNASFSRTRHLSPREREGAEAREALGSSALRGNTFQAGAYTVARALGGTHEQAMGAAGTMGFATGTATRLPGVMRNSMGSPESVSQSGKPMHQPVQESRQLIQSDRSAVSPGPR